jgi:hypothetical protein
MWLSMYGFRTHHQVAGHVRPLVISNIATRRAAEQTNPLGEGEFDCELDRARPVERSQLLKSLSANASGRVTLDE